MFSIIWIMLDLISLAILTANITSALTAVSLDLIPNSLNGLKVGLISLNHYFVMIAISTLSIQRFFSFGWWGEGFRLPLHFSTTVKAMIIKLEVYV